MKDKQIKEVMGSIENRIRHIYNCGYQQGYEDGKKAELAELKTIKIKMPNDDGVGMIEKIKDLIRECEKIDAFLLSYPAWTLINKLKKIVGWQLEDYEERQTETETWISMDKSRKITVPKGTFEKILSDADDDYDI